MISLILFILLAIIVGLLVIKEKFKFFEYTSGNLTIHFKQIFTVLGAILVIIFQPYGIERIDAGSVGIIENLVGTKRGAGDVGTASGYQPYNTYTQKIHEIETDVKNIHYPPQKVILKGGFVTDIEPTFNLRVKESAAALLFTDLRQTFKTGGLKAIQESWLATSISGAINDVSNRYEVDSTFNYREAYEKEIELEVQKRVAKYFEVTQFRSNIVPPDALKDAIEAKTKAVQEAAAIELQKLTTQKEVEKDIIRAEGDLKVANLQAAAKKALSTPEQLDRYKAETERMWAQKGVSPYGSNNVFGSNSLLLNR